MTLNFFRQESATSRMANAHQIALISTRVYVAVFTLSLTVLALTNGLGQNTITVTINSLSLAYFEQLHATYQSQLSCPCERIAVPYNTFISVEAKYHQVSDVCTIYTKQSNEKA